jgi:hypothetical protein
VLTSILRTVRRRRRVTRSCRCFREQLPCSLGVTGTFANPYLGQADNVGIDTKITSSALFSDGMAWRAISGPSYDQQPVFAFSNTTLVNISHVGMPDVWNFPWITVTWAT